MNKLFVSVLFVFGMITSAFGQQHGHEGHSHGNPEERAKKSGEAWQKKLGLSEEEKAKFIEAKKVHKAKLNTLRNTKPVDKAAIKAAHVEFNNSVKAAFTPEHHAAWVKTKEEYKKKRSDKKGKKGGKDKSKKNDKSKPEGKGKKQAAPVDESNADDLDDEDDDDIDE